jgi:hypothetical protein
MPATVIPVTGLNLGPVGSISQSDFPLRTPRQVNPTDIYNIAYGEPVVLNPNNTYSSVKQNLLGGDLVVATTCTLASTGSAVMTVASAAGIVAGQVIVGAGVTPGTTVSSISGVTVTMSANAAATESAGSPVSFYTGGIALVSTTPLGVAISNVRTNPNFPMAGNMGVYTPGGIYVPGNVADVLVQGTVNVQVNNGTPTAGGPVYIRVALNGLIPAGYVGGFEAVVDPNTAGNTILVNGMKFKTGVLGTDGTAQLTIPTRMLV